MDIEAVKQLTNDINRVVDAHTKPLHAMIEDRGEQLETVWKELSGAKQKIKSLRSALESNKADSYPGLAVKESVLLNRIYKNTTQALQESD